MNATPDQIILEREHRTTKDVGCASMIEDSMKFFGVTSRRGPQYYNGEFSPYPDLSKLFLTPWLPSCVRVEIRTGTKPGDMMFSAFNVVSERFVAVLASCHATGYSTFPVEVRRSGQIIPGYYGLKLLGRGGPFDEVRSNVERSPDGEAIFGYSAVYMVEDQWDGSDVFAIPGLGIGLYVTERVAEGIRRAKLTNIRLTLNSECRTGTRILQSDWDYPRRKRHRKRK